MASVLPKVDEYISRLPQGLGSYPDALAKAEVAQAVLSDGTLRHQQARLPAELVGLVKAPLNSKGWIPETHLNALILAHTDVHQMTDQQYYEWFYRRNVELLSRPLFRLLLMAVTPDMVLKGATHRFMSFHRGTNLSALPRAKKDWTLMMSFRPNLIPPLVLRGYSAIYVAAMELAQARGVDCQLTESGVDHAVYRLKWG